MCKIIEPENQIIGMDIIPTYEIKRNNRYIDVFCFPDGTICFHGFYDYNYSFSLFEEHWRQNADFSGLISKLFFDEWLSLGKYMNATEKLGYSQGRQYSSYRFKFYIRNENIVEYSPAFEFCKLKEIDIGSNVGKYINNCINSIYTNRIQYKEDEIINCLHLIRQRVVSVVPELYEEELIPIEQQLSSLQFIIFGDSIIQDLYRECWCLCEEKYNQHLSSIR